MKKLIFTAVIVLYVLIAPTMVWARGESLASKTYYGDTDIKEIIIPDGVSIIESQAICGNDALEKVTLPAGLEVIASGNFFMCASLTEITLPSTLKYIGDNCFYSIGKLEDIYFQGPVPIIEATSFAELNQDVLYHVPRGSLEEYKAALPQGSKIEEYEAENTDMAGSSGQARSDFIIEGSTIRQYKGEDCVVYVPETVDGVTITQIGPSAFAASLNLYAVILPDTIEKISDHAFDTKDDHLSYINLPENLKELGDYALEGYQGYELIWPEGLLSIGKMSLANANIRGSLILPSNLTEIGEGAFQGDWRIQEVYFPASVQKIASLAFDNIEYLTHLIFAGYSLLDMADDAFGNRITNITDIDLPYDASEEIRLSFENRFKEMGADNATVWIDNPTSAGLCRVPNLDDCTYEDGIWTSYTGSEADLMPHTSADGNRITGIGEGLFKGSQTIKSFYPHHCGWFTTIGKEAFADSSLEYIEIFDSITTIESGAFRNCKNLKEISLPSEGITIADDAFEGCDDIIITYR